MIDKDLKQSCPRKCSSKFYENKKLMEGNNSARVFVGKKLVVCVLLENKEEKKPL